MSEKVTGYILLGVGIAIIVVSALNILFIFTGQAHPVKFFNFPGVNLDLSSALGLPSTGAKTAPSELISSAMLNDSSNLLIHLFIVGFFVNVGYKISSLGIELLRPVVVKLREEKQ